MPEKRKASLAPESRPQKKQQTTPAVIVEHIRSADVLKPIIVITPGATFPTDIAFKSYQKKSADGSNLLLHSSEHPTIDYTAVEGTESDDAYLKHYVAVYDPSTNKLKVSEAKRLTVRGAVRQRPRLEDDEDNEDKAKFSAAQGTRSALTEAFGSKKSKKAVQSMNENRQLGQGEEGATIAEAITSRMEIDEDEEDNVAGATVATTARANKPIPQPNLTTNDIEEVYSLPNLIIPTPASNTLQSMPSEPWKARLRASKEITGLRSRFIANRVAYIGKRAIESPEDTKYQQQLQILRYIELLIEIAQFATKQHRRHKMKFVDEWPEHTLTHGVNPSIIKRNVDHYFPDNIPSDRAMTLLRTSIFALTLHIFPPSGITGPANGDGTGARLVTEPTDIQLDLALSAEETKKLYHEIGCAVKPATEKDLTIWGYQRLVEKRKKNKEDSGGKALPKPNFAILKFPLDFPKMGMGARKGKK